MRKRSFAKSLWMTAVLIGIWPVTSLCAADFFNVNFDAGFTGTEKYDAAANKDTGIAGQAPSKITRVSNSSTVSAWTASVAKGDKFKDGYLRVDIESNAKFAGHFEAFAPESTAALTTGKVHVSFDYSMLSAGGGPLMYIRPLGNYGEGFSNEVFYYDACVGQDKTIKFVEGQIYRIVTIIDLDAHNYKVTVDGEQVSHGDFKPLNGGQFSGFVLDFLGRAEPQARSFGLDNLVAGPVENP